MKGKTTFLFLIAFVLAFAVLAAAQGGNAPNGFGGGGGGGGKFGDGKGGGNFGKGGGGGDFGKGDGGKGGDFGKGDGGKGGDGDGDDGKNGGDNADQPPPPPGNNNDDKSQICLNGKFDIGDGTQQADKSTCITTQMGQLPTFDNMVASMILKPQDQSTVEANKPFQVDVAVSNIETGFFSDAAKQYYTESQVLNDEGIIQGHSHITIQRVQPKQAETADPRVFDFFEGLNDPAKNGVLSTTVPGLAQGFYRACTMTSSFTHQPVLMPVAKRGAQDDCIRFFVR